MSWLFSETDARLNQRIFSRFTVYDLTTQQIDKSEDKISITCFDDTRHDVDFGAAYNLKIIVAVRFFPIYAMHEILLL